MFGVLCRLVVLWNTIAHLPDMTNSSVYFEPNSLVGNSTEVDRAVQLLLKGLVSYIFSAPRAAVKLRSSVAVIVIASFLCGSGAGV